MKAVKAYLVAKGASAEEVSTFEKGAQTFAKKVVANFKDYEFLIGESMDINGMYVTIKFLSCLEISSAMNGPTDMQIGLLFLTIERTDLLLILLSGSTE